MVELKIADDLSLPAEAVTQTFSILAKRGSGKTYTALVFVEELLAASLQTVVVDPVGVAWGLRSSADGEGPGMAITVLGGDHGDLAIGPGDGEAIADVVIDTGLSFVLDLSLFRKGEQTRFVTDFAERLYHRNRSPLQLVLDEADAFAPQRPIKGQERMLGAVEDLVRRGRARGIGVTLITQRPAVLHKDVLTQCEVLIALRLIAPQDREAIDAWIRVHGTPEQRAELMASLPSLPIGTAWVWSPGWLDLFQKVRVRARRTFDSSATPKVGQVITAPKVLAAVDLAAIRARLEAAAPSLAETKGDHRNLRRALKEQGELIAEQQTRIADLERRLAERPGLSADDWHRLEALADVYRAASAEAGALGDLLFRAIGNLNVSPPGEGIRAVPDPTPRRRSERRQPVATVPGRASRPAPARAPTATVAVNGPQQRLLDAIATYESFGQPSIPRPALAALSGLRVTSGHFTNMLGSLRSAGLVDYPSPGVVALTEAGRAHVQSRTLASLAMLHEAWLANMNGPQRRIFRALLAAYPRPIDRETLASQAGLSATSGHFTNTLGSLRTLGAIDYPRPGQVIADDVLFPEGLR